MPSGRTSSRPDHADLGVLLDQPRRAGERPVGELAVGVEGEHELVVAAADGEVRRPSEAEVRVRLDRHSAGEYVRHELGGSGVVAVVRRPRR